MAEEQLGASLDLSTDDALERVSQLRDELIDALTGAVDSFTSGFESAISGLPDVNIEPNTDDVAPAIEGAIAGADSGVPIESEGAEQLTLDIDSAIAGADSGVPVVAEGTEDLTAQITAAAQEADATVTVEADTSQAEADIESLASGASGATSSVDGLGASVGGLNAVSGLATGSAAGLGNVVSELGDKHAGIAVAGIGAVGVATAAMFNEAVEATGATQRFNLALGDSANAVENLSGIPTLNTNLGDLALSLGSDDDKIRTVAARMFDLAHASGVADADASTFTQQLISMGARAVALNPALGDVGDVTDSLSTAMVRGGRFATKYGLDLNQDEINARALNDTHKSSVEQLTFIEKAMAGAAIASEKYGGNLDTVIAQGSENAITKQRRLKQTIVENIEALGMPLVAPIFDIMEEGIPIAEEAGRVIALLAQSGLPLLQLGLEILSPILGAFADGLEAIGPDALTAIIALTGIAKAVSLINNAMKVATLSNPWLLVAAGVVTLVSALGLFEGGADDASASTREFTDAVLEAGGALDETSVKALRSTLETRHQIDDLNRAGVSFKQYTAAIDSSGGASDRQIAKLKEVNENLTAAQSNSLRTKVATSEFTAAVSAISPELGAMAGQLARSGELNDGLRNSIIEQIVAMQGATTAAKERSEAGATDADVTQQQADAATEEAAARDLATAAVNAYKAQLDALISPQLGLLSAQTSQAESLDRVREAYQKVADDSTSQVEIERGRTESLIAATRSTQDLAVATYNSLVQTQGQGAATAAADAVMQNFATTLRDQLITGMGLTAEAADAMLAQLGLTPVIAAASVDWLAILGSTAGTTGGQITAGSAEADAAFALLASSTGLNVDAAQSKLDAFGNTAPAATGKAGGDASSSFDRNAAGLPTSAAAQTEAAAGAILSASLSVSGAAASAGLAVGQSFGYGIAGGIDTPDIRAEARAAAARVVDAAERGARDAADSHSPSRLFAEVGADMGSGLAIGFEQSGAALESIAESLVGRAAAASSGSQGGAGAQMVSFNVNVYGVTDPAVARQVGKSVVEGASDALTRRRVTVAARVGA